MLFPSAHKTVFKRYNAALLVAFFVIVLIALSVASIQYITGLSDLKKQSLNNLTNQAQKLNTTLETSVKTITSIQQYGQYILDNPDEFNLTMPLLEQEGKNFFLDASYHSKLDINHDMHSNITGIGDIKSFSLAKQQEIAMANLLLPSFITGKNVLKESNWFFYVSLEKFVNIYPWINRNSWHYTERFLTKYRHNIMDKLVYSPLKSTHNDLAWSPPYIDAAGTGMNTSIGLGLYRKNELIGAIMIDIDLSSLQEGLEELTSAQEGVIVYNERGDIILFKQLGDDALSPNTTWDMIRPENFTELDAQFLASLSDFEQSTTSHYNGWLVEQDIIPVNGWKIARFQSYDEFSSPLKSQIIFLFVLLFFGFLAFLFLVNSLTRRSFIQPTQNFIEHIEHCAKGDPGKIKPSSDWLPWFYLVEDIFIENRSFFQQLKDQNSVLDARVNEKTQALRESSEKHQRDYVQLRSVMNAIPELIIFNDPNGLLMGCNQEFESLTHHSEMQMLGKDVHQYLPKDLSQELDKLSLVTQGHFPKQALIHSGKFIYQGYCNQIKNQQNEILGTIIILQDVTQQQETQEALELAKNTAENANKVKIQFLANMSHEIRTPINAMQGMMELLEKTLDNSRQYHYLSNAQTASVSLLHLVDELLDLSKIEAGKMVLYKEPVNLSKLVDKAIKLNIGTLIQKALSFNIMLDPQIPHFILCDEMRLVQVISNLLNNAAKFTEHGVVELDILLTASDDNTVSISFGVKDSGIGIDPAKQVHLFKAFSQADESMTRLYGGSGLGLSICQQIVNLFGGEITIASELGQGSCFSFSLDFARCEAQEEAFNNGLIKNLPLKADDKLENEMQEKQEKTPITLCVINQALTTNFVDSVKSLGWHIENFSSFEAFNQSRLLNVVLLIEPQELMIQEGYIEFVTSNEFDEQGIKSKYEWHRRVALVALCQNAMTALPTDFFDYFTAMSIPNMLLDLPLYRYALLEINNTLAAIVHHKYDANFGKKAKDKTIQHLIRKEELLSEVIEEKPVVLIENEVSEQKALSGLHVLLVEDNLVNQLVEEELLLELGAKVTLAENGAEAVEFIDNVNADNIDMDNANNAIFDVVLMDIQMPIMDGLTAAKKIRSNPKHNNLPIIAMTAHARDEDEKQSLEAGMDIHIAKPVTSELLSKSILDVISIRK
ncbi:MAG: ATP-binding protein [Colwellia sp.]